MKSRVFWLRITGILLCCMMLVGALSVTAFAAEGDATVIDLSAGDVTIAASGEYALRNTTSGHTLTIAGGTVANLLIDGVTVNATGGPAICVRAGATLNLTVEGTNSLRGSSGYAGICVEAAYDSSENYIENDSAKLTISGGGTLTATGGAGTTSYGSGAGIGGNGQNFDSKQGGVDIGTIIVSEDFTGTIHATGGRASSATYEYGAGAGIGCGGSSAAANFWGEIYGQIFIRNGTINATGGTEPEEESEAGGPGIGGSGGAGYNTLLSYMTVEISGGNITAIGCDAAAGIGGGNNCNSGTILISGGYVYAGHADSGSFYCGAAIGGGDNAAANYIEITGGTVIADSKNRSGAGIGHGNHAAFGILEEGQDTIYIKISGKDTVVYAYGGTATSSRGNKVGSAGIGLGASQWSKDYDHYTVIQLTDGATVYAYGGYQSQAIGYCYYYTDKTKYTGQGFRLDMDDSITLWAVNGDYHYPALVAYEDRQDETVDVSHLAYVSTERYLVTYTNDAGSGSIRSGSAVGTLTAPEVFADSYPVDATLTWELNGDQVKFTFDDTRVSSIDPLYYPFTGSNQVGESALHGNWATLCPPIIGVWYEWVGDSRPQDVNPPDMEYVMKGSAYTAKQQAPTGEELVFDGWYTDAECTTKFVDGTALSESITLYGRWIPKAEGSLTVSKQVTGTAADLSKAFSFTVTLDDAGISGKYGDMTFVGGVAEFMLKHGESRTAEKLPAGVGYTVTESGNEDYIVSATGAEGTIVKDSVVAAAFTNRKDAATEDPEEPEDPENPEEPDVPNEPNVPNEPDVPDVPNEPDVPNAPEVPKTGSLTVTKQVAGSAGDTERAFAFTVMLSDTGVSGVYGDMTFSGGVASFTLRHGESKTAKGLPAGARYSVSERDANQDGYATTSANEAGVIAEDATVTAIFVNAKDEADIPQTGDSSRLELWMALAALSLLAMAVMRGRAR